MSIVRKSRLWKLTESIRDRLFTRKSTPKKARGLEARHLLIDPLEERTLLSLSIGSTQDILVNTEWQDIRGEVSVAINSSNDAVAVWTAADKLVDPVTGEKIGEDLNIYARYMTDEVQIVTIPVYTDQIGTGTSFELIYGSAVVKRLSFYTATTVNDANDNSALEKTRIDGTLTLNVNGKTVEFAFDENLTPLENAANLQTALRSLGKEYTGIEVNAYTERDFDISFFDADGCTLFAQEAPEMSIDDQVYESGFVAGALVETISEPTLITGKSAATGKTTGITVSADADKIAQKLEAAFEGTASTDLYAPLQRSWFYNAAVQAYEYSSTPSKAFSADQEYLYYTTKKMSEIEVSVQALETTTEKIDGREITYFKFQITFTGNSGYVNHQELKVSSLKAAGVEQMSKGRTFTATNTPYTGTDLVETIKESSSVFRVNAPEPAQYALDKDGNIVYDYYGDPVLEGSGKLDQFNPTVAFDDAGNFTIAWESAINDQKNENNYFDIYARRFTIQGYVDLTKRDHLSLDFYTDGGVDGVPLANSDPYLVDVDSVAPVQSVRPLADQFLVNVETNGSQQAPSISCDADGNFVISWTTDSQWNSYYAGICARWYDKTGLALTDDVVISSQLIGTPEYGESYVKMGPDGTTVIVWSYNNALYKSLYAPGKTETFVSSELVASDAYSPSIDFDSNGRYVLAWTEMNGGAVSLANSQSFSTVTAGLYYVYADDQNAYHEATLATSPVSEAQTGWPTENYLLSVGNVAVGMDADGDIFFAYQGFGHDMQESDVLHPSYHGLGGAVSLTLADVEAILTKTGNQDLLPYFEGWFSVATSAVDVDLYVAACLSSIQNQIRDSLYEKAYSEMFEEQLVYINARYEVRNAQYTEIRSQIEAVITAYFHEQYADRTLDYYYDNDTVIKDVYSDYYGMTYGEVVELMFDPLSDEKLNRGAYIDIFTENLADAFTENLADALNDYYYAHDYDRMFEDLYAVYKHEYSDKTDEEIRTMVDEEIARLIGEDVQAGVDAFLAEFETVVPRQVPEDLLAAMVASGQLPPVDVDAVNAHTKVDVEEWVLAYMQELEINEYLFAASDYIHMRTLGYTEGWYTDSGLPMSVISVIDGNNGSGELGETGIRGIDDWVKSDLTSTYAERYDELYQEKLDTIRTELLGLRTAEWYENSLSILNYMSPEKLKELGVDYTGMTYSEIFELLYNEASKLKNTQDGEVTDFWDRSSEEYQELYDQIFAEVVAENYDKYKNQFETIFYSYINSGVVMDEDIVAAMNDYINTLSTEEALRRTSAELLNRLLVGYQYSLIYDPTSELETEEYQTILEEFRAMSEAQLRVLYREAIRPDYTDETGYVNSTALDKRVALAPTRLMIRTLVDQEILKRAESRAEAELSGTIEQKVREDYLGVLEIYYNYLYTNRDPGTLRLVVDNIEQLFTLTDENGANYPQVLKDVLETLYSDPETTGIGNVETGSGMIGIATRRSINAQTLNDAPTVKILVADDPEYKTYRNTRTVYYQNLLDGDEDDQHLFWETYAEYLSADFTEAADFQDALKADFDSAETAAGRKKVIDLLVDRDVTLKYKDNYDELTETTRTAYMQSVFSDSLLREYAELLAGIYPNRDDFYTVLSAASLTGEANVTLRIKKADEANYDVLKVVSVDGLYETIEVEVPPILSTLVERDLTKVADSEYYALRTTELHAVYEAMSETQLRAVYQNYLSLFYVEDSTDLSAAVLAASPQKMINELTARDLNAMLYLATLPKGSVDAIELTARDLNAMLYADRHTITDEIRDGRYDEYLYGYYKPIIAEAVYNDYYKEYSDKGVAALRASYRELLLEHPEYAYAGGYLKEGESFTEVRAEAINDVTVKGTTGVYNYTWVNEDALANAVNNTPLADVIKALITEGEEVASRTTEKVNTEIGLLTTNIMENYIFDRTKSVAVGELPLADWLPAEFLDRLGDWVISERVRRQMVELEVDDVIYDGFYEELLLEELEEWHSGRIDTDVDSWMNQVEANGQTRRENYFTKYYNKLYNDDYTALLAEYRADSQLLLKGLLALPESYEDYKLIKDVDLEAAYLDYLAPYYTDSQGQVDEDALNNTLLALAQYYRENLDAATYNTQAKLEAAVASAVRQEIIWTLICRDMEEYASLQMTERLSAWLTDYYSGEEYENGKYVDAEDPAKMGARRAEIRGFYTKMDDDALVAEYKKMLTPDYVTANGSVNGIELEWAIANVAQKDDDGKLTDEARETMVRALTDAECDLEVANLVHSKIEETVSVLVYQALVKVNPKISYVTLEELYTNIIGDRTVTIKTTDASGAEETLDFTLEGAIRRELVSQKEAELRAMSGLTKYNEKWQEYWNDLLTAYTDSKGKVDDWGLTLAVEAKIAEETQRRVDESIRDEAEAAVTDTMVSEEMKVRMAATLDFTGMTPADDKAFATITIDYTKIAPTARSLGVAFTEAELYERAWTMVAEEIERLVGLRVSTEYNFWVTKADGSPYDISGYADSMALVRDSFEYLKNLDSEKAEYKNALEEKYADLAGKNTDLPSYADVRALDNWETVMVDLLTFNEVGTIAEMLLGVSEEKFESDADLVTKYKDLLRTQISDALAAVQALASAQTVMVQELSVYDTPIIEEISEDAKELADRFFGDVRDPKDFEESFPNYDPVVNNDLYLNKTDDATHLETQSSIVYDDIYADLFRKNFAKLYEKYGREMTYDDLANDDTVFEANQSSPYYGLTYAQILKLMYEDEADALGLLTDEQLTQSFTEYYSEGGEGYQEILDSIDPDLIDAEKVKEELRNEQWDTLVAKYVTQVTDEQSLLFYTQFEEKAKKLISDFTENEANRYDEYVEMIEKVDAALVAYIKALYVQKKKEAGEEILTTPTQIECIRYLKEAGVTTANLEAEFERMDVDGIVYSTLWQEMYRAWQWQNPDRSDDAAKTEAANYANAQVERFINALTAGSKSLVEMEYNYYEEVYNKCYADLYTQYSAYAALLPEGVESDAAVLTTNYLTTNESYVRSRFLMYGAEESTPQEELKNGLNHLIQVAADSLVLEETMKALVVETLENVLYTSFRAGVNADGVKFDTRFDEIKAELYETDKARYTYPDGTLNSSLLEEDTIEGYRGKMLGVNIPGLRSEVVEYGKEVLKKEGFDLEKLASETASDIVNKLVTEKSRIKDSLIPVPDDAGENLYEYYRKNFIDPLYATPDPTTGRTVLEEQYRTAQIDKLESEYYAERFKYYGGLNETTLNTQYKEYLTTQGYSEQEIAALVKNSSFDVKAGALAQRDVRAYIDPIRTGVIPDESPNKENIKEVTKAIDELAKTQAESEAVSRTWQMVYHSLENGCCVPKTVNLLLEVNIENLTEYMVEAAIRGKAEVLADADLDAQVKAKIDANIKKEIEKKVAEDVEKFRNDPTDEELQKRANAQEIVRRRMLEEIVVPDALHAQTLEQLSYLESLVMYAQTYRMVYIENIDLIREMIYEEEYSRVYAEQSAELTAYYTPIARQQIHDFITTYYADGIAEQVETDYGDAIAAVEATATAQYDTHSYRSYLRGVLTDNMVYTLYLTEQSDYFHSIHMDLQWGITYGSTEWWARIDSLAKVSIEELGSGSRTAGLEIKRGEYIDNSPNTNQFLGVNDQITAAVNTATTTYTEITINNVINSVDITGVQPDWTEEDNPIPDLSTRIENLVTTEVRRIVSEIAMGEATQFIKDGETVPELERLTKLQMEENIKRTVYAYVDTLPEYIQLANDILGRCNAVLEYNLQYLRGAANDILYTTFNSSFTTTTGDAKGVINAQRDGNNATFYLALPYHYIADGHLVFQVTGLENNGFETTLVVAFDLVVNDVNMLIAADTRDLIIEAFNLSGLNIDAGWFDSVAVEVVGLPGNYNFDDYEGTYWAYDEDFVSSVVSSTIWPEDYAIYAITFQGGSHDTDINLTIHPDSTLGFVVENDFYAILEQLTGGDEASRGFYDMNLGITWETTESEFRRSVINYVSTIDYGPLWELLYEAVDSTNHPELANELFIITRRLVNNYYDQFDSQAVDHFRSALVELLDSDLLTPTSAPTLYSVVKYITSTGDSYNVSVLNQTYNILRSIGDTNYGYDDEESADPNNFLYDLEALSEYVSDREEGDNLWYEYALTKYYSGYRGTPQMCASVGMTDSGTVTVAWQQKSRFSFDNYWAEYDTVGNQRNESYSQTYVPIRTAIESRSTQIYMRSLVESTDYAGARATSVTLPNGDRIEDGDTITTATKNLVVSFTENLKSVACGYGKAHSVDNVDNWFLYRDGVLVEGAIEKITFGMSESRSYARGSNDKRINGTDGNPNSLAYGTNLWEAVITFKDDYELSSGNYTLVASNMIHDIAGNAINSRGLVETEAFGDTAFDQYSQYSQGGRDGSNFEVNFSVISIDLPLAFGDYDAAVDFAEYYSPQGSVGELLLPNANEGTTSQYTTEELLEETDNYDANTPQSVASDANGNFVAVWTEAEKEYDADGNWTGVYLQGAICYKVYRQEYVVNEVGQRVLKTMELTSGVALYFKYDFRGCQYFYYEGRVGVDADASLLFEVPAGVPASEFALPQQASVAMDDRGNFVIVWDMIVQDDILGLYNRDVYARRYLLSGEEMQINGYYGPYRVNIETEKDQQNASIAMDSDGDFVIVWESYGQDGSGWGIFGRRFDDLGYSFGSSNTVQLLSYNGTKKQDLNFIDLIVWVDTDGDGVTERYSSLEQKITIEVSLSMTENAENIREGLLKMYDSRGNYLFQNGKTGTDYEEYINVVKLGTTGVYVEFIGIYERQEVPAMQAIVYERSTSTETSTVSSVLTVNITQTATGSYGTEFQVNDTTLGHQRFADIGMNSDGSFVVSWTSWGQDEDSASESNIYMKKFVSNHNLRSSYTLGTSSASENVELVISSDDPTNHEEATNAAYSGVCMITAGDSMGTGALLTSGIHVLTAAHVVWDSENGALLDPTQIVVEFESADGEMVPYFVREIYLYPGYAGDAIGGDDIAVLLLSSEVDNEFLGFDIYRNTDELGLDFTLVGYGQYGTGDDYYYDTNYDRPYGVKHSGMNTFELTGSDYSNNVNPNILLYDFDDNTRKNDTFGRNYGIVHYGLGDDEAISDQGDSGGPCFIDGKIAGIVSWGSSEHMLFGDYAASVRVSSYADWIDKILAGAAGGEVLVNAGYEDGVQIWSDVAIDNAGNTVVTWTSFNQDGHGDTASGGSSNGLAGVYMRYYVVQGTQTYYSDVELVNEYTGFDQAHSKIDMDAAGNFVIVWESYQERTYKSDQPVADGIYAKRFLNSSLYYEYIDEAFPATGEAEGTTAVVGQAEGDDDSGDGAGDGTGDGSGDGTGDGTGDVTTPPTDDTVTETVEIVLTGANATGAFARIPAWMDGEFLDVEGVGKVSVMTGSIGGEYSVNETKVADLRNTRLDDQLGGSVALNSNGDMIFVWTDINNLDDAVNPYNARVMYRTISLTEDDTPPYVTSVTAAYGDPELTPQQDDFRNVSLMGDTVTFAADHGPYALVYTFSELMFSKQFVTQLFKDLGLDPDQYQYSDHIITVYQSPDVATRSVLNIGNWTLLKDGAPVTASLIDSIYYGYNAGERMGYINDATEQYELVIKFKDQLTTGVYQLTLSDRVTDLSSNKLDGNYDHVAGGSFSITFNVGVTGIIRKEVIEEDDNDYETARKNPGVVTFADGSFIIVAETLDYSVVVTDTTGGTTGGTGTGSGDGTGDGTDDGTTAGDAGDGSGDGTGDGTGSTTGDQKTKTTVSGTDISFRKYDATDDSWTTWRIANNYTYNEQINPDIDGLNLDTFAVVWTGEGERGLGTYARFYNDGVVCSSHDVWVNQIYLNFTNRVVADAQIAYDSQAGAYLITWRHKNATEYIVMGRYFGIDGTPMGDQFVVAAAVDSAKSIDSYHVSYSPYNGGLYTIAWSALSRDTNTTEIYAKTFLRNKIGYGNYNITESGCTGTFMVNQTTANSQYEPATAMNANGEIYIVWTSTQTWVQTGRDVYIRRYSADGTAQTGEMKVNAPLSLAPYDSNQISPSISAVTEGYIITWCSQNSEYDVATNTVNYDVNNSKELYDYGILASVYSNDNKQTSIYLVNYNTDKRHYTYGDQLNPVISIVNWDQAAGAPKYVVAWDSPVRYKANDDDSYSLMDTYAPGEADYLEQEKILVRYWPGIGTTASGVNTIKLLALGDDTVAGDRLSADSGSGGFYRPTTEAGVQWTSSTDASAGIESNTLNIAGTTGNDTLEIILSDNGSFKSVKLNGVTVSTEGYANVVFAGQAGDDTLVYSGGTASSAVVVYGDGGKISITAKNAAFSATGLENFQLDAGGKADSLTVSTSKGNDKLTIGVGEFTLTSSSRFAISAVGFEEVIARSTAGTDTAVLLDSKKDDELEMSEKYARFVGGGSVHEVYGFATVQATSSAGADTVIFSDVTSLTSTASLVIGSTAYSVNKATGFNTVTAVGNGSASATIIGSRGSDHLESTAANAAFTYCGGKSVTMSGFAAISVNGNGGADTATLTGGAGRNTLTGRAGSVVFGNGTFTRTLNGFTQISAGRRGEDDPATYKAIFYDSIGNDTLTADGDSAAMSFGGSELYSVMAFDQVTVKKEKYSGTDTVKVNAPVDFVLENDGWRTL